jgi:hypothetical protein
VLSNDTRKVVYGSAKFEGFETQDKACLNRDEACIKLKFLSLTKGEGLDAESDGILGLSPEISLDRNDQHFIWSLMNQGVISKASMSLSLADQSSFAIFGGIEESQIVDGIKGLKPFRNNPDIFSHVKAWALTGKGMQYGDASLGQSGVYPAIMDTGSTLIIVPSALFAQL